MKSIEIISIPVTDQEKAKAFYVDQLGFSIINEAPFDSGQKWIQLGLPGTQTTITLVNWFKDMPAGCIQGLLISTDDIQLDIDTLIGKGINVGKIDSMPWGKFANFKDPDGNGWSLHER
ncbi:MAG: glyoxalase superfamily protein [Flavipsychrobacter sp.]|nr:glyoxalase superfamily protein [Flavipsychrobacter sp.]